MDLFQESNEGMVSSQPSAGSNKQMETSHTGLPRVLSHEPVEEQLAYTTISMPESGTVPLAPETHGKDFSSATSSKQGN